MFAVAATLAKPDALVIVVAAERTALPPEAGAVKVTVTPLTGLLDASRTSAVSAAPKGVPRSGPVLARVKLAGMATPVAETVIV